MRRSFAYQLGACVAGSALLIGSIAEAVPYASQVRNTTGDTWEFVLNTDADSIVVLRDGGNPFTINSPAAGRHTFDMAGFSDFEIQVARNAPDGWAEISDENNLHTNYFRPTGLVVNQDPSSAYFGTVYVSHPIAIPSANPQVDRGFGDGIYSLSADMIAVDLTTFAAQPNADDQSLAKNPPGWVLGNNGGSSPWKLTLDDGNNLIAADFGDQNGGIWYSSPDLSSSGGAILAQSENLFELLPDEGGPLLGQPNTNGVRPLLRNADGFEVHGSILSRPSVSGTVGVDLTVWAIDEDYDLTGNTFDPNQADQEIQTSIYHPLRWDVGAATEFDQPPTVTVNKDQLTVEDGDFSDFQFTLPINDIGGVITNNMLYEPQFNKYYLLQSRTHGNESGLVVVSEGPDADSPVIEWSSKRFSFDNGLDGNDSTFITDEETGAMDFGEGIQDIFRNIDDVIISEDGSTMYLTRTVQFGADNTPNSGDNPVLGEDSNAPGGILVIPLDENGVPDIIIDDNGTPGDASDDFLANVESIPLPTNGRTLRSQVGVDAAGNVYHVDNITERLFVFSPGGNTIATTTSAGTFGVAVVGPPIDGDFNNDGMVDAADYTLWRDNLGGTDESLINNAGVEDGIIDVNDYLAWRGNFGATASLGTLGASVPEPGSLMLACVTLIPGLRRRSRR
ncbi:MAG: hypothetical protein AAGJ46_06885 [Planctomycetota bacterium]